MTKATFSGYFDGLKQREIHGWCKNNGDDGVPAIEIFCNGAAIHEVQAVKFRQDLLDAGIGDGHYAFSIDVSTLLSQLDQGYAGEIQVSALVKGTTYELPNSPLKLDIETIRALSKSSQLLSAVQGRNDHLVEKFPSHLMKEQTRPRVLICGGVPCSDVGGGQRSAQLARAFKARSWEVVYTYIYPAVDTTTGAVIDPGAPHYVVHQDLFEAIDAKAWLRFLQKGDLIIVEIPHSKYIELMTLAKDVGITTVYEIIDDWESSLGGDWYAPGANQCAVELATITTHTAHSLKPSGDRPSFYEPNAVDLDIFDPYSEYLRPADLPQNGKPNFLYFGSLYGEWFWWDALVTAADDNKDSNFVLIGHPPKTAPLRENIYYLGGKQNEELPAYLKWSEYAICPFAPGKIAEAVSPVKIFEYLAMHKASVTSGVIETKGYPGVFFANTAVEFSNLCAMLASSGVRLPRPVDFDFFSAKNSWQTRIESILRIAESAQPNSTWNELTAPGRGGGDPKYSLIILCHNNRDVIWRCVASLNHFFESHELEIIVVDNESTDASVEVLEAFGNLRVIRNVKNGCSSGRNLGLKYARGQFISFLDSDQYVCGRAWLTDAANILEQYPSVGAIGWAAGWFNEDLSAGPIAEYMPLKGRDRWHDKRGFRVDVGYLGTGGMVMSRERVGTIGSFDEFYDPTCFEDTDWSLRIKAEGYQLAYMRSPTLLHQAHQTTNAGKNNLDYKALFARNEAYLIDKFKMNIDVWEPVWR